MSARHEVLARLVEGLRSVRPRFWAWGAAGAAALLVAVLVIPTDTPASGTVEAPGPSAVLLEPADAAVLAALVGDDPAAAARALVERRTRCLAMASAECVSDTAQSGSAQEAADLAAIDSGSGGAAIVADGEPRVQRLGDSALVTFASTALLLVRTDQGWRIRDRFTASG